MARTIADDHDQQQWKRTEAAGMQTAEGSDKTTGYMATVLGGSGPGSANLRAVGGHPRQAIDADADTTGARKFKKRPSWAAESPGEGVAPTGLKNPHNSATK